MTQNKLEIELLINCCNPQQTKENKEKITALLKQEINWKNLLNLAKQHGVTCIFYQQIKASYSDNIPSDIFSFLKQTYLQNSHKNLKFTGELLRLVNLFEKENIPVISFKGSVLAQLAYHNLGVREFEDLDLLIKEEQLLLCDILLKNEGYLPQFQFTNQQLSIYQKLRSEFIYWHPQKDITIDLHWSLLPKYFSFSDEAEFIWQNYQQVLLNNHQIKTLTNELNILFLCSHGAKHDWLYLCWIIDLATFINKYPNLDWDYIILQIGNMATKKMLLLGLYLTDNLFRISLPQSIIKLIEKEQKLIELSNNVQERLWKDQEIKKGYVTPEIYLQTFNNTRDKIWFWIDTILTPTALELELITLPKFLFQFYYVIRFVRLILKYSKQLTIKN